MKKCPYCGAQLYDEARFCLYCMKQLDEKEVIVTAPKKPRRRALIISLSVVLALLATVTPPAIFASKNAAHRPPQKPQNEEINGALKTGEHSDVLSDLQPSANVSAEHESSVSETLSLSAPTVTPDDSAVSEETRTSTVSDEPTEPVTPTPPDEPTEPVTPTPPDEPTEPVTPTPPEDETTIPPHVHAFGAWKVTAEPTCTEKGLENRFCASCEEAESRALDALGHLSKKVAGKKTTCTEEGLSEGAVCARCGQTLAMQTVTPPLGHSFTGGVCVRCGIAEAPSGELAFVLTENQKAWLAAGIGSCKDEILRIPSVHNGLPVTGVAPNAFENLSGVREIVLPESIVTIGARAFASSSIEKINLPASADDIGLQIFYGCRKLTDVYYNASYAPKSAAENPLLQPACIARVEFGQNALDRLTGQSSPRYLGLDGKSVILGDGVTTVYKEQFFAAPIVSLSIGKGVKTLPDKAFKSTALKELTLSAGIEKTGFETFWGSEIKKVDFLGTVSDWCAIEFSSSPLSYGKAELFFSGQPLPDLLVLPDGLSEIGACQFEGCSNLKALRIPSSVCSIGSNAFYRCAALHDVYFDGTLEEYCTISTGFFSCPTYNGARLYIGGVLLEEVAVPESVSSLPPYLFMGCTSIKKAVLPASLTQLSSGAFWGCTALADLTLPEGLVSIGANAFTGCTALKDVSLPRSLESVGNSAFQQSALSSVRFGGSEKEWGAVVIEDGNDPLKNASVTFGK